MLLLQAGFSGLLTETLAFPALAMLAALIAFLRPFPMTLSRRQRIYGILALCLFFGIKMRLFPLEMSGRFSPFPGSYELNHALAQLLLVIQILLLGMRRFDKDDTLTGFSPWYLMPFLGAAQLALIADFVEQSPWQRQASVAGASCFALLFGAYLFAATNGIARRRRAFFPIMLCVALLLAAALAGTQISRVAAPSVVKLDVFLFQLFQPRTGPSQAGISNRSTLQSIRSLRETNGNRIALRIEGDAPPVYLRAYARDRFDGREWTSLSDFIPLQPVPAPSAIRDRVWEDRVYPIRPGGGETAASFSVWAAPPHAGILFATLDTALVAASPETLRIDAHHCCTFERLPQSRPYLLVTGALPGGDAPEELLLRRCLEVPDSLSDDAVEVCRAALQDAGTTREKIEATVQFFKQHYRYQIGIDIPHNQDPVSYFLTERPGAHCEFFASGAAMMLRLAGVPCRYVTGFIVTGKSGAYWVARNRDAHAWVEAWDPDRGWVVVEATPPDGLPQALGSGPFSTFLDGIRFRLGVLWAMIREEGFNSLALAGGWLLEIVGGTWPGRVILAVTAVLGMLYAVGRFRPKGGRTTPAPDEMAFRRLLARMDAQARRYGFIRKPHETLHQFAARIAKAEESGPWHAGAAAWYRDCANLRCGGRPKAEMVDFLEKRMHGIGENDA
jgi:protein-glutamine gamma-glutamyltransferase